MSAPATSAAGGTGGPGGPGGIASGLVGGGVLGIGVDAVDIARYRAVLARTPRIAERTFTDGELTYARQQHDPAQRLAARFAAKEAAMKALGVGLGACRLHDIEIVRHHDGHPELSLHGAAAALAASMGVARLLVSLTHTELVAVAFVTALSQ